MQEYNGIIKTKTDAGEFYTEEYVRWLEDQLKEIKKQLSIALSVKRNYESQADNALKHYWDSAEYQGDCNNYADDEYDR
jgi:hypothetical protein